MQREIRRTLYEAHKHDLGCPEEWECTLFKKLGTTKPCGPENGCKNFLTPVEAPPDPDALRRVKFLTRLESMVAVGCKFQLNDLDWETWTELILLAHERQRMREVIDKGKDAQREKPLGKPEEKEALAEARKELGIGTGPSLFPQKRPMS